MIASRIRGLVQQRPVWVTACLLVAWLAFQAWTWSGGRTKLRAAGLAGRPGASHVELILAVSPEPFHMAIFQDAGRLIGVRGSSVFLMDVPPDQLQRLARAYWVRAVRPWSGT